MPACPPAVHMGFHTARLGLPRDIATTSAWYAAPTKTTRKATKLWSLRRLINRVVNLDWEYTTPTTSRGQKCTGIHSKDKEMLPR